MPSGTALVILVWTYGEDLAIEDISLTPQSYTLSDGSHVVQLSIGKNILVEGLSYEFELRARYASSMSNTKAIAAVAITMNEAPTGGDLKVMPTTGVAVNTTFFFQTSGWDDDVDDFPLSYVFAYYVSRPYEQLVVKTSDELTYGEASLGQGRSGTGMIVCVGNASDIYGAQGTVTNNDVTVFPVENLIELRTLASSFMEQALIDKDATSLNNVATAVTSSLNAANCSSLPFVCADLNREECNEIDGTDHTCGPWSRWLYRYTRRQQHCLRQHRFTQAPAIKNVAYAGKRQTYRIALSEAKRLLE